MSGMSRRVVYTWLAEGRLRAIKCGAKTLMDIDYNLSVMRSLPKAQFVPPRRLMKPAEQGTRT